MNTTSEQGAPYTAPETWQRATEQLDAKRPFPEVLHERMEAAGIESDEALWERFEEVGGETLQRWRFMKNCKGENMHTDARFIRGVIRVLGYDFDSEEAAVLGLSYFGNWRHKDFSESPQDGRGKA